MATFCKDNIMLCWHCEGSMQAQRSMHAQGDYIAKGVCMWYPYILLTCADSASTMPARSNNMLIDVWCISMLGSD